MLLEPMIYGVLLPAVFTGTAIGLMLLLRRGGIEQQVGGLVALAGGVWLAQSKLVGAPEWPATESMHWFAWSAMFGAGLGLLLTAVGHAMKDARGAAVGAALVTVAAGLMLPKVVHSVADELEGILWGVAALAGVGYAAFDDIGRRRPVLLPVLLTLWTTGVSIAVVLGETASFAQLLGALAATLGGASTVGLLFARRGVDVRALAAPTVLIAATALVAADQFANLSSTGMWVAMAAPGLIWAATRVPLENAWAHAAVACVTVAVPMGVAGYVAFEPDAVETAAPGSIEEELDYGYDSLEALEEEDSGPDYSNMGDWKPPPPPE